MKLVPYHAVAGGASNLIKPRHSTATGETGPHTPMASSYVETALGQEAGGCGSGGWRSAGASKGLPSFSLGLAAAEAPKGPVASPSSSQWLLGVGGPPIDLLPP